MKKMFLSLLAIALISGAAYASNGKKRAKKAAKAQKCEKMKCPVSSSCNPSNCVPLPGCCK